MAFRQKLVSDIRLHFKQCKWEDLLHEQIVQLLQMAPQSPYDYLQKRISLRSKLDNSKHSSFTAELLVYCLYVNPLTNQQNQIENKIMYLCVEKYQHTKIRRNQAVNVVNGLFLLSACPQKEKELFLKLITLKIQGQTINACQLARILFCSIVFLAMKRQIDGLNEKLEEVEEKLNQQILRDYLGSVNPLCSILKKVGVDVDSDANIWKVISIAAAEIEGDL